MEETETDSWRRATRGAQRSLSFSQAGQEGLSGLGYDKEGEISEGEGGERGRYKSVSGSAGDRCTHAAQYFVLLIF